MHYVHTSEWLSTIQNLNEITNELIKEWDSKLTTSEFKQNYLRDFVTEIIINDDNEYEPSPDTEKYKEWKLKERFVNEMVELNKVVRGRDKKQK